MAPAFSTWPARHMRVWDTFGGRIAFAAADVGAPAIAYMAEAGCMRDALIAAAALLPNVTLCFGRGARRVTVAPAAAPDAGAAVELDDRHCIRSRLVVGADGAGSVVRAALSNNETIEFSYEQRAIVASVRVATERNECAWQRLLPTGPLAVLPVR